MFKLMDKKINFVITILCYKSLLNWAYVMPNKKKYVSVTGLKILGRVGTTIFKYNFMHFERHFTFR